MATSSNASYAFGRREHGQLARGLVFRLARALHGRNDGVIYKGGKVLLHLQGRLWPAQAFCRTKHIQQLPVYLNKSNRTGSSR